MTLFGKTETASAHCDIPCGVYDARTVMYHAVSTLRLKQRQRLAPTLRMWMSLFLHFSHD